MEKSKAVAISLGADPITIEKDISDIMIFGKELAQIYGSHPVTKPSSLPLQGVSRSMFLSGLTTLPVLTQC